MICLLWRLYDTLSQPTTMHSISSHHSSMLSSAMPCLLCCMSVQNIPNAVQMVKLPWISYAAPVKLHQEMQNKERKEKERFR